MKIVHLLLLGAFTAEGVHGTCQGHYIKDGRFSLCIGDSDCTHPNNFCSEGRCNKLIRTCVKEYLWFNSWGLSKTKDNNDNNYPWLSLLFGKPYLDTTD